jgi:hypothetical protein
LGLDFAPWNLTPWNRYPCACQPSEVCGQAEQPYGRVPGAKAYAKSKRGSNGRFDFNRVGIGGSFQLQTQLHAPVEYDLSAFFETVMGMQGGVLCYTME